MQYPVDFTSELRYKPICGVMSVAIIAGVTFARATQVIKNNLMPWQKRHGGRTYHEQRLNALRELGINFIDEKVVDKRTLRNVVQCYCQPNKTYMINTTSHVVTVRDCMVIDQYEHNNILNHGSKRCFVRNITEIL